MSAPTSDSAKTRFTPTVEAPELTQMFHPRPFPQPTSASEAGDAIQTRSQQSASSSPKNLDRTHLGELIDIPLFPPQPEAPPVQAKLTIGQPGDQYEQEADRTAAQVMAMPEPQVQQTEESEEDKLHKKPQLQREPEEEEDALYLKPLLQRVEDAEDEVQTKPLIQRLDEKKEDDVQPKSLIQREPTAEEEEKETISRRPQIQAKGAAPEAPANFEGQLAQHRGGGQRLGDETRSFMESRFGADFSGVRVHEAPDLAGGIQAQAFTHGQDIYFNAGKYNPGSSSGKELLAHELTHTIQQTGGKVQRKTNKIYRKLRQSVPADLQARTQPQPDALASDNESSSTTPEPRPVNQTPQQQSTAPPSTPVKGQTTDSSAPTEQADNPQATEPTETGSDGAQGTTTQTPEPSATAGAAPATDQGSSDGEKSETTAQPQTADQQSAGNSGSGALSDPVAQPGQPLASDMSLN